MGQLVSEIESGNWNLQVVEYKGTGAKHLYAIDEQGKKHHISHDAVLAQHGYKARPKADRAHAADEAVVMVEQTATSPAELLPPDDTQEASPSKKRRFGLGTVSAFLGATATAFFTNRSYKRQQKLEAQAADDYQVSERRQNRRDRRAVLATAGLLVGAVVVSYLAKESGHLFGLGGGHGKDLAEGVTPDSSNGFDSLLPSAPTYPNPHTAPGSSGVTEHLHDAMGQSFQVEFGHGNTHEIMDYAQAHNYGTITPQQAAHINQELFQHHGPALIDLNGSGHNVYARNGSGTITAQNVGISHPGKAHWNPGVEHDLRRLLNKLTA